MDKITFDFKNRTAIVTGGAQGFGFDIAKRFLKSGAKVIIWDNDPKAIESAIKKINNSNLSSNMVDVSNYEEVEKNVKEIVKNSNIDILINNAANDERHKIEDVTEEYWNDRINVNLRHYFFSVQSVREIMIKNKSGVIVNVGSISWMIGQGGMAIYTAAKSAVVGLTRSFARDLGEFNIRVNSVVPGWTITERQID